jgi:hypothetical protein
MHAFYAGVNLHTVFDERCPLMGLRLAAAFGVERVFVAHAVVCIA